MPITTALNPSEAQSRGSSVAIGVVRHFAAVDADSIVGDLDQLAKRKRLAIAPIWSWGREFLRRAAQGIPKSLACVHIASYPALPTVPYSITMSPALMACLP